MIGTGGSIGGRVGHLVAEIGRQVVSQVEMSYRLGVRDAVRFRAAMFARRFGWHDGRRLRLRRRVLDHPVSLRIDSTDAVVFHQVLRRREYAAAVADDPRVIVDCGANAGYTSAYLLSRYKQARVVAIEPFPANAALCRENLAPYGDRATVIEGAVWSRPTRLVIEHGGGNEWGVRVRAARAGEAGDIDGIDIPSLGLPRIDILKVDIEGSETELFRTADPWLPTVRTIAVELHGPECEHVFRAALADYDFEESTSGELTICTHLRRRLPPGAAT